MTLGPLHHSSPGAETPSPVGYSTSSPVAGSTILHSMFAIVGPTESSSVSLSSKGIACDTGDISDMPYPCRTLQPRRFATDPASSLSSGAAPENTVCTLDRSYRSTRGCLASATATGGAMNTYVHLCSEM